MSNFLFFVCIVFIALGVMFIVLPLLIILVSRVWMRIFHPEIRITPTYSDEYKARKKAEAEARSARRKKRVADTIDLLAALSGSRSWLNYQVLRRQRKGKW